jgi:excisionase family DNA binding protein
MNQSIGILSPEELDRIVSRAIRRELEAFSGKNAAAVSESLTPQQAADYLNQSVNTLRQWRAQGRGPAYEKRSRSIYYRRDDLDTWRNANRVITGEALESLHGRGKGRYLRAAAASHV